MTTGTTARFSTRELQAAAAALAAGRFAHPTTALAAPAALSVECDEVDRNLTTGGPAPRETGDRVGGDARVAPGEGDLLGGIGPVVRVRAANAGAGASTVTLALADAADCSGVRARILDAAAPAWSGLLGATVTELGAAEGWRRGRRGANVLIDRVQEPVWVPADVPAPRPVDGVDLTVLDAGWTPRELAAAPQGAWVASARADVEVLVTRPYELALSQAEASLVELTDQLNSERVVVVVIGAGRWSDREFAGAGRLLRTAHEQEAVLFAPLLSAKALPGLGPDPLPKQLTNPSQHLLERITTITGPLTANRT
ncbi:hypothetical protein K8Z61_12715 [Nocardioides sp. TRM66260-LWL]|uniref:hypothetical protein n=1 Tax=Nocardioides sp. TRM66260-LWL TaxID=2874478 RepID=UPI001CC78137|nr:hypothetical protein [Nocardioides sp. TRM66260-LWL]MBZ5735359.1 hypothetical protein [Nocardioides sp. TRM66260-LWL]